MTWLAVAVGGALGSLGRYGMARWMQGQGWLDRGFPWATLTVNWVGCFLIAVVVTRLDIFREPENWRAFLVTGILGGFTTFSSFGLETITLLRDGQLGLSMAYVLASLLGGLALVWLGFLCFESSQISS